MGCSGNGGAPGPDDGPATPGLSPAPGTAGGTDGTPTLSADGSVDCSAVATARDDLLAATDAELARLDIDRSDQEAFGITLLVATRQAPRYWAAVRDAVTPDADERLRAEVADVASHWEALADDLTDVEVADGSAAAVQRALDEVDGVRDALPAERVEALQAAQERTQAAVDRACGAPLTSGRGVVPGDRAGGEGAAAADLPVRA